MTSVVKIYTGDLLRHPDVTWHLAVISQDIEQLSDAFLFFIDTRSITSSGICKSIVWFTR